MVPKGRAVEELYETATKFKNVAAITIGSLKSKREMLTHNKKGTQEQEVPIDQAPYPSTIMSKYP